MSVAIVGRLFSTLAPPCVRVVVHPCTFVSIFQVGGWDDDVAYSAERKAAVLKKMLPPNNVPLRRLSQDEGISEATLHSWRKKAALRGRIVPHFIRGFTRAYADFANVRGFIKI